MPSHLLCDQALRNNSSLQSLDLSQNPVGSADSVDHLKRLLMGNTRLQNLFLWNVGMVDAGAIILGEGVCACVCLFMRGSACVNA